MKKLLATLLILVACIHVNAQESRQIRISTDRTDLILEVAPDGRLYQSYLGDKLTERTRPEKPFRLLTRMGSLSGVGWRRLFRTGRSHYEQRCNLSTILRYVSSEQKAVEGGTENHHRMKDEPNIRWTSHCTM